VSEISVRRARTGDIPGILAVIDPLVQARILLGKERVTLYEAVQQFRVAEASDGQLIGCGALHVMWEDLGEVRTLAAADGWRGRGVGHALLEALETDARELGLRRLFCLTFEVDFFAGHGYAEIEEGVVVSADIYTELLRSPDDGVAEFLDLARVKQNTLGNTRMLKQL
jgi:amino-acid N-acetyltransferase